MRVKWIMTMAHYFTDPPKIIVNGFFKARITVALNGHMDIQGKLENDDTDDIDENESDQGDVGVKWTL